jgi:hypothetical protein
LIGSGKAPVKTLSFGERRVVVVTASLIRVLEAA